MEQFFIREDEFLFISSTILREHLSLDILVGAISNFKSVNKIFIGVVAQKCFRKYDKDLTMHTNGLPRITSAQVIMKNITEIDQTTISDTHNEKRYELF